jgi:hypothetical protein
MPIKTIVIDLIFGHIMWSWAVQIYPLEDMTTDDFSRFVLKTAQCENSEVEQASYLLRVGYAYFASRESADSAAKKLSKASQAFTVKSISLIEDDFGRVGTAFMKPEPPPEPERSRRHKSDSESSHSTESRSRRSSSVRESKPSIIKVPERAREAETASQLSHKSKKVSSSSSYSSSSDSTPKEEVKKSPHHHHRHHHHHRRHRHHRKHRSP